MRVDGVEVIVEGAGPKAIVMIHGWPDTHRLWDAQVAALKERYRCVRFTLPGFEAPGPRRAYAFDEVLETIRRVIDEACPNERVTLLLHDWGCFFGYQFAMRHPGRVERIVGVDIGDAGSRQNRAELGARGAFMVVSYQLWLALAWRVGGRIGDAMARAMARAMRCPTERGSIHAQMGYPYALRWLGAAGGLGALKVFKPHCPMLFLYGERKPIMFHSHAWARSVESRAFATGHWIMVERPGEFNAVLLDWLAGSEPKA